MKQKGVEIITNATITYSYNDKKHCIEVVDTVVFAAGYQSNNALYQQIKDIVPGKIKQALASSYKLVKKYKGECYEIVRRIESG